MIIVWFLETCTYNSSNSTWSFTWCNLQLLCHFPHSTLIYLITKSLLLAVESFPNAVCVIASYTYCTVCSDSMMNFFSATVLGIYGYSNSHHVVLVRQCHNVCVCVCILQRFSPLFSPISKQKTDKVRVRKHAF